MLFRGLCQAICYFSKKLKQQTKFRDAITGFPTNWRLRSSDARNSILMTSYWWCVTTHANLSSASNWSCRVGNLLQPIRSSSLIWVVTLHQYGIPSLVSQTSFQSFHGETSDGVANCRLSFHCLLLKTMFRHRDCLPSSVATDGKNRRGLELENVEPNFHVYLMLFRRNTKHYPAFREPGPWLWPGLNISAFCFRNYKISLSTFRNRMTMAIKFSRHSGSCERSKTLSW